MSSGNTINDSKIAALSKHLANFDLLLRRSETPIPTAKCAKQVTENAANLLAALAVDVANAHAQVTAELEVVLLQWLADLGFSIGDTLELRTSDSKISAKLSYEACLSTVLKAQIEGVALVPSQRGVTLNIKPISLTADGANIPINKEAIAVVPAPKGWPAMYVVDPRNPQCTLWVPLRAADREKVMKIQRIS